MKYVIKSIVVSLIVIALVACSSGNNSSDGSSNTSSGDGKGGILKIGLSSNAATLDPIKYTGAYESQIMRSIADTLIVYDKNLDNFTASLATEWEPSEDLKSYTFKLRDDVYFQPGEYQDGRQMTAEDVKFSLERSAKDSAQNRLQGVESVEVVNDFEVIIHLEKENSALLAMLTDAGNVIVPKEEVDGWGDQFGSNLIGTGPFTLEDWKTDQEVNLTKSENYWGEEPNLDGVTYKFISDQSQMTNSLRSGDIHVATDIKGQNREIIEQEDSLELLTTPGLSLTYIDMNYTQGPTSDPKVREAITKATDIEAIVEGIHKWGGGTPAIGPIPESSWGFSEDIEKAKANFDPEEAKKILSETEYADGFEIELYTLDTRAEYATIFQNQMKENLNIDVKINVSEWGTLTDIIANNNAPMNVGGWSWYPDPYFFLNPRYHSNQIGSNGNGKGFDNEKVDELLDRANTETADQDERAKLYQEAAIEIMEDYGAIEIDNLEIATGISNKVKGFNLTADGTIIVTGPNGVNISLEE